jgi:hypothetical protein
MTNTAAQIEKLQDLHYDVRMDARDVAKARNELANVLEFLIFKANGDTTGRSVVECQKIYKLLDYELRDLESQLCVIEEDISVLEGED